MRRSNARNREKQPTLGRLSVVVAVLGSVGTVSNANAAEPEPPTELHQVLEDPDFNPSPAAVLRWDREAEWSRLALADAWELHVESETLARGPLPQLGRFDLREDVWQATPYAATTVASAFAALATRGIPVVREMRDFRTIRTHRLGCYFKGRGGGVVWRLEF